MPPARGRRARFAAPCRGRGLGADDMPATPSGPWIASDNDAGADTCGGVGSLAGICFLPCIS